MRPRRIRRHAARTREGARSHRYAAGCCRSGTPLHPPHAPFALRQAARKPKNFAATSASRTPRRPNTPRPRRNTAPPPAARHPRRGKAAPVLLSYPFSIKLSRVEPDMPKTRRHGGLSLFHPWQAAACLRAQNENPIPATIVFAENHIVFDSRQLIRNTEPAGRGFGVCCYPSSSACLFTVRMVRLFCRRSLSLRARYSLRFTSCAKK